MLKINSFDRAFFGRPLIQVVKSETVKTSKRVALDSIDDFNKHFLKKMLSTSKDYNSSRVPHQNVSNGFSSHFMSGLF